VNLELEDRDFLGLIGPNGGGKSTLIKVIMGLIVPQKGSVRIFGQDPASARSLVGYLPQKSLFDHQFPITAFDVVLMGRYGRVGLLKRYSRADREAALRALEAVDMQDLADREIGSLSGGEQQRVFVARALVSEPRLLLLDEPTSGVDSSQQTEFYDMLCRLNQQMTIIMVSHDLTAVSRYVKKIACLNRKLYYHGSKELPTDDLEAAYGCPVDMIAHGMPHRVLKEHD
ncbi:MAG: ABC transporter ATP-binding protein, partial [Methanosarcinales archaeon]|nr:ABC transporter ATP-binding protein [Methanosarcinales archaeon]